MLSRKKPHLAFAGYTKNQGHQGLEDTLGMEPFPEIPLTEHCKYVQSLPFASADASTDVSTDSSPGRYDAALSAAYQCEACPEPGMTTAAEGAPDEGGCMCRAGKYDSRHVGALVGHPHGFGDSSRCAASTYTPSRQSPTDTRLPQRAAHGGVRRRPRARHALRAGEPLPLAPPTGTQLAFPN